MDMEQAKKKKKLLCSDLYFIFLALSCIQKSWKKEKARKKENSLLWWGFHLHLGILCKASSASHCLCWKPWGGWHKTTSLIFPRYCSVDLVIRILFSFCSSFHMRYREQGQATGSGEMTSMNYNHQSFKWFKNLKSNVEAQDWMI